MKKMFLILLALVLVLPLIAVAEDVQENTVEMVQLSKKLAVPADTEYVDFGTEKIGSDQFDKLIANLQKLPNLKKVDMFESPVWKSHIEKFVAALPDVEFGWTMRFAEHTIRTDATAFSTLHNNKSETHSSRHWDILKYCKNLVALDLGHNSIDDISFIRDIPSLKVLILACNYIEDITPLEDHPNLEYIELFKNRVKDVSVLASMPNLIDLNLCYNYIEDYSPLYEMEQLERLWIYNSNNYMTSKPVPMDIVNGLKEALPNTHIDYENYSTGGGWREHDRYFVIYEMFKNGTYSPFASSTETAEAE